MAEIVNVHFQDLDQHLLDQVLEAFYRIRSLPQIKKKPSTSEIIDWIQALIHGGYDPDRVVAEVPYLGVLLKKNEDIDAPAQELAVMVCSVIFSICCAAAA